jgi:uncharacterized protein DUF3618
MNFDADETEAHARDIQRDIERTRERMDHTLTELERRLAPSEILHSGVETVRVRVRSGASSTVETLKQHPMSLAIAAGVLGIGLALRPSTADRRQRRAEEDIERAVAILGTAFARAKEHAQFSASNIGDTLKRAAEESRLVGSAFYREAASYPLGALALAGVAAGVMMTLRKLRA